MKCNINGLKGFVIGINEVVEVVAQKYVGRKKGENEGSVWS